MFTYKVTPFKLVSFGSNTLLEAVLPSLEALLEIFFCEVFQSVGTALWILSIVSN
jgi:hypothetical protein